MVLLVNRATGAFATIELVKPQDKDQPDFHSGVCKEVPRP